jgi:hypothetical protein
MTSLPQHLSDAELVVDSRNTRHHAHTSSSKLLVFYGAIMIVMLLVGAAAIWSFLHRQALVLQPEPLPKVTIVTGSTSSPIAASWVKLLSDAEMSPTLVPLETFDPIEGVVVFCDIETLPPRLADTLAEFVRRGGAIAFVGKPPATAIGGVRLLADSGPSGGTLRMSESASPLLARLDPGREVRAASAQVSYLKESPRMVVDARWRDNARAAVMHMERDGGRYIWIGINPDSIDRNDRHLKLMLKSAFRWVAGQPVSDGAVGEPELARTLAPAARREARADRFAFSVDRTNKPDVLTVRMVNRGAAPIENPTVKVWLPSGATSVSLAGDFIMKRNATVTAAPGESACFIALPSLGRGQDRVMKLKVERSAPTGVSAGM